MSKHFRPWNIDQTLLLPPNVRDFVPKDHVSRFIVGLVRESLDLKAIMCSYVSGLGQPDFVMIVALDPPDFRTISDFRKRHLKAGAARARSGRYSHPGKPSGPAHRTTTICRRRRDR
jgi:hypothetical protein